MRIALDALKGHSLNVERYGSGARSIIAIHGFMGSAATWNSFIEAAGNEYSIICPELPGHGKSDSPEDPKLYDMKHTVQAMAEIADRMNVSKAHWLGYSLGGRIAIAMAVSLKGRALSLTVESASAGIESLQERKERVVSDEALADKMEKGSIQEFVNYWESQPVFGSQARLPREIQEKLHAERLDNNVRGLANSLRGIGLGAQPPLHKKLSELDFPCLFVAGEEDIKFSNLASRMQNSMPRSQLFLCPKSGHNVHVEQPEMFNRAVMRFLMMSDCFQGNPQTPPGSQPSR